MNAREQHLKKRLDLAVARLQVLEREREYLLADLHLTESVGCAFAFDLARKFPGAATVLGGEFQDALTRMQEEP